MASGLVIVDKPSGWTSHQVVGRLRRMLHTRKVGHAGTLDPMATGVLILGVNRATRLLGHLALSDKTYLATVRLGQETVTDDADGEVIASAGAARVTDDAVRIAVGGLRGTINQVPSAVSAIKVDGQRAYARVRRGEDVTLAGREVTISRFDITGLNRTEAGGVPCLDVDIEVDCSSGTYVRALARDLGRELGVGGHLTRLRRVRVGGFALDQPHVTPAQLEAGAGPVPLIGMADAARSCFPVVEVDAETARDVGYGRSLPLAVPGDPTAVLHEGAFLALYRPAAGGAAPVAVLVSPAGEAHRD